MASRRNSTTSDDYPHRATLEFRGLTYRYNKSYGEWRLVGVKKAPFGSMPETVMAATARTTHGAEAYWRAGGTSGRTPLAALEAWAKSLTNLRRREAREAERHAKDLWAEVRRLERPSWKAKAPPT